MKKVLRNISLLLCCCLPASCLTTLQPLVTAQNVVTEDRITGTWQSDKATFTITSMAKDSFADGLNRISGHTLNDSERYDPVSFRKFYHIQFEKNGISYNMTGALTRINGILFIQFAPALINDHEKPEGSGYELIYYYLPSFTIAKLQIDSGSLTIDFLNGEYIKEQIRSGKMRIKHEKDELCGSFVITASSNELAQFLEKYGGDERLFSPKNSITLTRKGSV